MEGHSHGHSHGPVTPPEVVRGQRVLAAVVALLALGTSIGLVLLRPTAPVATQLPDRGERVGATITAARVIPCSTEAPPEEGGASSEFGASEQRDTCQEVDVRLDEGPEQGQVVTLTSGEDVARSLRVGQGVIVIRAGGDVPLESRYQISDVERGTPLAVLTVLFVLAVLALGRLRGAAALLGLVLSLLVLVKFLVPALLVGRDPLITAVVGAMAVMIFVLLLAHGPNVRTAVAMISTAICLLLIVGLSVVFVRLAGLTGLTSDETGYVAGVFGQLDLRGLLLAGIVIGALGLLDDVTVTQVSTVWELRNANPAMPGRELYAAGLRVGRDHIASTVNTLLLAYAGASLPLLVIFTASGEGFLPTVTTAVVAEEVVRTLAGSIGLVAAVPVATGLAALVSPPTAGEHAHGHGHEHDSPSWASLSSPEQEEDDGSPRSWGSAPVDELDDPVADGPAGEESAPRTDPPGRA